MHGLLPSRWTLISRPTARWGLIVGGLIALGGCNRLARSIYLPAPTPLFMEDGLRIETLPAESPSDVRPASITSRRLHSAGENTSELQPPSPPAEQQPPPLEATPPATPRPLAPYEPLPATMGVASGVTLSQAIDEALNSSVEIRAG